MSREQWFDSCIEIAKWVPRVFALAFFIVITWLILGRNDPIKPFPSFGPFEIPKHPFLIFACTFALYIAFKLHHWLLDYKNLLPSLPIPVLVCWGVSELLLAFSCLLSEWWLLIVAFLLVARMVMDSLCRFYSVRNTNALWDVSGILKALGYCVIVVIMELVAIWYFAREMEWYDCIVVISPILLLIIPRILMDNKAVQEVSGFADYAWYPAVTAFVFFTSFAQICFKKLSVIIIFAFSKYPTVNALSYDLLSLFVILYLIGLIGCFKIFPRATTIKKG